MKHKIIYGTIGSLVIGAAVAIPLSIVLTDHGSDLSDDEIKLRDLDRQIELEKVQIRKAQDEYNRQQETATLYRNQLEDLNDELALALEREDELVAQIAANESEISRIQAEKDAIQEQIDEKNELLNQINDAETEIETKFEVYFETMGRPHTDEELANARKEWDDAKAAYAALTATVTPRTLQAQINSLRDDMQELTSQQTALSDRIAEVHTEYLRIDSQVQAKQQELDAIEQNLSALEITISSINSDIEQLNDEKTKVQTQLGFINDMVQAAQTEVYMYEDLFGSVPTTPGYENIWFIDYILLNNDPTNQTVVHYNELKAGMRSLTSFSSTYLTSLETSNYGGRSLAFFRTMINIESLYLPNATIIGENAFADSTKLKTIYIPKATSIGNNAFAKVPNTPETNIFLPIKFNTYSEKNRIFGDNAASLATGGRWDKITFHWIR